MKKYSYTLLIAGLVIMAALIFRFFFYSVTPTHEITQQEILPSVPVSQQNPGTMIQLPPTTVDGEMSVEKALSQRRSIRTYRQAPLNLQEVSQLLWAAQGVNNERGFRTAPSAGATFPLDMFVMVNNVEGLAKGIYKYLPHENQLEMVHRNEVAGELARASLSQSMITDAGVVLVFAAVFERTTQRYNERGIRYVYNEVGHAGQNVHLQAEALNLGTVVIGAYRDEEVEQVLNLGPEYKVLYLMPVGKI